jgi:pilus assembly protein CpaE
MNSSTSARRVCVIGQRLVLLAREALPGAEFEVFSPDALYMPEGNGQAADLVLIDGESAPPNLLAAEIEALARRDPQPAVVLAGGHLPTGLVKAFLRLERSDVLDPKASSEDLARIVAGLMGRATASTRQGTRCWSVMGAVGGAGATTIAIEIAALAAAHGSRACLVDLNVADGASGAYLGAKSNMLLAGASPDPQRIDAALLEAFAAQTQSKFDLFACPRDPLAFQKVSAEAVCRVLEIACSVYDWVVVDVPRLRQPWTLDVLAGSDETLIVSELTVPALLSARALASDIENDLTTSKPRLVLNRLANRMLGSSPSLTEAEKALERKAYGGITSDWEAAAASVNLGGSIRQHRPRSKIVRDVAKLVEGLLAEPAPRELKAA